MKRIGLLGGTFNPPHWGHLKLAELAVGTLGLDAVWFVPTAAPPHKPSPLEATDQVRCRLLAEALAGTGLPFRVEPLELDRGGTSYTVDTLEALAERDGQAWIFLMGSDQLRGFDTWKRPERILELASLAVAPRPGHDLPPLTGLLAGRERTRWSGAPGELIRLPGTELDLASTALRGLLKTGITPPGIPPQVMALILRENQYR